MVIGPINNAKKVNKRNRKEYNEELVVRGEFYFDFDFSDNWNRGLDEMNRNKNGRPYRFSKLFIMLEMAWHQLGKKVGRKNKFIVITITADVRTKKLLEIMI